MTRVGWLTDIHLDSVDPSEITKFLSRISMEHLDAVLIGGDIGHAENLEEYLGIIGDRLRCPVYFVLGNHDYYYSSFEAISCKVREKCRTTSNLHWLVDAGIVPLSKQVALIGHDGWADGRNGRFFDSQVHRSMTDYFVIEDLCNLDTESLYEKLNEIGDAAAEFFRNLLPQVLDKFERIVLLTHVPPFRGACWHEGQVSDDDFLPHFSCRAVGEVLREMMDCHPNRHMTVYCGHTHSAGTVEIAKNLLVKTGGAEYGAPVIQEIIQID